MIFVIKQKIKKLWAGLNHKDPLDQFWPFEISAENPLIAECLGSFDFFYSSPHVATYYQPDEEGISKWIACAFEPTDSPIKKNSNFTRHYGVDK